MREGEVQPRPLSSESAFHKSHHTRGGIASGTYALDIIPTEPVAKDKGVIPSTSYRIRLAVQLNFLTTLFDKSRLAAQTGLADVETDLEFVIQEIKRWKYRLKTAEREGFLVTQYQCGTDWHFLFESSARYASQEAAWDKGRELLQLLFHGRPPHAAQTGSTRRVR